jgi:hypothetical protein
LTIRLHCILQEVPGDLDNPSTPVFVGRRHD